jgi:hypothetical protein
MYIATLVDDITKVLEHLRSERGDFVLAMLYSRTEDADGNWNLIISAPWVDELGKVRATDVVAKALTDGLGFENKPAISRITALPTTDPFVRQVVFYAGSVSLPHRMPIRNLTFADVPVGSGVVFYSQPY